MTADRVLIFDTTLRDGEQSPGAAMSSVEKLEIARALARLGVDIIEAGFPAASPDDLEGVRAVANEVGNSTDGRASGAPPTICGLARATDNDLHAAWEAVKNAARPRIHTFLATSPIHRQHKLRMSAEQVIAQIRTMVAKARDLCADVEFSAEDATRTEPEFLFEVVAAALEAGATTINLPDTVGYATPDELAKMIGSIRANVPQIERAILSVHCHDDLGMATANTLAGIGAGARQAEVTINGIGERAGNCALEEVVMALTTRAQRFGLSTFVDSTRIPRTSRLVSTITGMPVQPNKAIVGANAFAHESGIHQDGMLKHGATYEIMKPESVGLAASRLVLGKHSGRHALAARLTEIGYALEGGALDTVFRQFKSLADRKKHVTDADLIALVTSQQKDQEATYTLEGMQIACGTVGIPTATVRIADATGHVHVQAAMGTGPVDACFKAIDAILGATPFLLEYTVNSVTEGIDALGEVSVRITRTDGSNQQRALQRTNPQHGETRERVYHGHGADTDILVASAKAYLCAFNRMLAAEPLLVAARAS